MNPILVLLIVFVVTLILGVPFAWSLLLASAASVCMIDGLPLMQIASKMYNGGAKYTLLAIFFFMLAGAIMQHGGISSRMIMFAKACGTSSWRPFYRSSSGMYAVRSTFRIFHRNNSSNRSYALSGAG